MARRTSSALCCVAAGLAASAASASAPLVLLTDARATCLDGTLSGLYVEPAAPGSANATKFVIFLEGGGECANAASCTAASKSVLGSSNYFAKSLEFGEGQFYASGLASNPLASWTRVDVPYCSQDLYSGTRESTSPETFGLYFSGHHILEAVFALLRDEHGLGSATEVVLTGASAGGIGAWINANSLLSFVPAGCRVTIAPVAGFYFFAFPYAGVNHTESTLVDFREAAWPSNVALWQSFIDPFCAAGLGARSYACMLSNYSFPFVRAGAFITEAQTDQVQLEAHDWLPGPDHQDAPERAYMQAWSDNMTQALAQTAGAKAGIFNPACYIHTSFGLTGPLLSGENYLEAFARWYFGGEDVRLADDCGVTCNPTCPH